MRWKAEGGLFYRLANKNGPNILYFVSAKYHYERKHLLRVGPGQQGFRTAVCGVHSTGNNERILRGYYPDGCVVCNQQNTMYLEAKELRKTEKPADIAKADKLKNAANSVRAKLVYYMLAVPGDYDFKKSGGKRIITPFCPNIEDVRIVQLTEAAFKFFKKEFQKLGLTGDDLVGMPVNFEVGKLNDDQSFAQVTAVEFFDRKKEKDFESIDLNTLPDFSGIGVFDPNAIEEHTEAWIKFLPQILSGKADEDGEKTNKKKVGKKKVGKKTSKRR